MIVSGIYPRGTYNAWAGKQAYLPTYFLPTSTTTREIFNTFLFFICFLTSHIRTCHRIFTIMHMRIDRHLPSSKMEAVEHSLRPGFASADMP